MLLGNMPIKRTLLYDLDVTTSYLSDMIYLSYKILHEHRYYYGKATNIYNFNSVSYKSLVTTDNNI